MLKNQTNLREIRQDLQQSLISASASEREEIQKKIWRVDGALEVLGGLQQKYALVDRKDWEQILRWVNDAKQELTTIALDR